MNSIQIRKALLSDLDVLLIFEQGIISAERPFDPTLKYGEIHYYDLAKYIVADDVEVLVAELDGQVISSGYARIVESKDYQKFNQHCYLGFMYTVPNYRGKGINNLILEALKAWALQHGINELRLEVYNENKLAIRAYEKAGFKPNLLEMRIDLKQL